MSWQEAIIHIGNFLLLPVFMGSIVGLVAWRIWFAPLSLLWLIFAGISGSLIGLIAGWFLIGQDGHTLGYLMSIMGCSLFICVYGGSPPSITASTKKAKK